MREKLLKVNNSDKNKTEMDGKSDLDQRRI